MNEEGRFIIQRETASAIHMAKAKGYWQEKAAQARWWESTRTNFLSLRDIFFFLKRPDPIAQAQLDTSV